MSTHTEIEILHSLLVSLDLGSEPASRFPWPIFIGTLPDSEDDPSDLIALFDLSIPTSGRIQRTGETLAHKGIQIRVRSASYPLGSGKMHEITSGLDKVVREEISVEHTPYVIQAVHQLMTPAFIGEDEKGRKHFTLDCSSISRKA